MKDEGTSANGPSAANLAAVRDKLWAEVYAKWYRCYFNEIVANRMVNRWQSFSDPAKVLTAITASGSVIAGWTLWSQDGYKVLWILLAGIGALLSVINTALAIPERIKDWATTKTEMARLRTDGELLMLKMKLHPDFDVPEMEKAFETLTRRFSDAVDRLPHDFLNTKKLGQESQKELDEKLSQNYLGTVK